MFPLDVELEMEGVHDQCTCYVAVFSGAIVDAYGRPEFAYLQVWSRQDSGLGFLVSYLA